MKTVTLRNIPVRFDSAFVPGLGNIWIADHANDISCDAIGVGSTRLAAARGFFKQIGD